MNKQAEYYEKIGDNSKGQEVVSWGGKRVGAGRPDLGRNKKNFYVTDQEEKVLREHLKFIRKNNGIIKNAATDN